MVMNVFPFQEALTGFDFKGFLKQFAVVADYSSDVD